SNGSTNWEERYRGQSRVITQKDQEIAAKNAEVARLNGLLEAARSTNATLQQQVSALESNARTTASEYEGKLATLNSQVADLTREKETLSEQVTGYEKRVSLEEK